MSQIIDFITWLDFRNMVGKVVLESKKFETWNEIYMNFI